MATRKKQVRRRKASRAGVGAKKAAGKKATAARAPRRKTTVHRKVAMPKKIATARRRPPRDVINLQQQLTKISRQGLAPSISGSRGPAVVTSRGASDEATMPEGFFSAYTGAALTEEDYTNAAKSLGCEVATVKAVAEVETAGDGFDANHRPAILYERHVFARNTVPCGKLNQVHTNLSEDKGYPQGGY